MAQIPRITRLSGSIIRILGCNPGPMTLQGTNTYLLGTGSKRILIDSGDKDVPEYLHSVKTVLSDEKATIKTIILTHWHHDHVGGVEGIYQLASKACDVWKFPRSDAPEVVDEIPSSIKVKKLSDGQELSVEGARVKVIHTPGHTTDHVVLSMEDGIIFSGDCILGEGTAVFEDLFDYMKSLETILNTKPSIIYPGHGNIIKDPVDRILYYINHRNQRESQIVNFFRENPDSEHNVMDVVKTVYKDTPEILHHAAAVNVTHHLKKLWRENVLKKVNTDDDEFNALWKMICTTKASL